MKIVVASDAHQPNATYIAALHSAGALPEEVQLVLPGEPVPADFDGLLIAGGSDVAPSLYGESVLFSEVEVLPERDTLDLALLRRAGTIGAPVLGICRGLQLINVALGGTLWQDLPSQRDRGVRHANYRSDGFAPGLLVHTVRPLPGTAPSPFGGILASTADVAVNSRHHQAVKDLAPGLVTLAESPDGLVEAFARPDGPYLAAVQWHPEDLVADPVQRSLFSEFLDAATARRLLAAPAWWRSAPLRP